jgi:hypothetical protein
MTNTFWPGPASQSPPAQEEPPRPESSRGQSRPRGVPAKTAVAILSVLAGPISSSTTSSLGPSAARVSTASTSPSAVRSGSGTLSVPKNLVALVTAWGAGRGGAALKTVSGQVGVVLQATGLRQYGIARSACIKLATGVAAAQIAPPIPDAAMRQLYQKALTDLRQGAVGCRTAISQRPSGAAYFKKQHDAEVLRQSTSVLSAGANELYRATGEINALERR